MKVIKIGMRFYAFLFKSFFLRTGIASMLLYSLYAAEEIKEPLKVLTIGNSFADSVFTYLPKIAENEGSSLLLERANLPGCPLADHWKLVERAENEADFKPYKGRNLKEILASQKWNVVTLQQASGYSWQPESYYPYIENLADFVRKHAPTAKVVIQQTWSYRFDEPRLLSWNLTPNQMYEKLSKSYNFASIWINAPQIPTGYALELARNEQPVKFVEFDLSKKYEHPELPNQQGSFVNGMWWAKNKDGEWGIVRDSFHLNRRGQYLQACLFYQFLFGTPATKIRFTPEEIEPADAQFLRAIAEKALANFTQVAGVNAD